MCPSFPVDDGTQFATFPSEDERARWQVLLSMIRSMDEALEIPIGVDVFGLTAFDFGRYEALGGDLLGRAGDDHAAAVAPRARAHVDDVVARLDQVPVVLDDEASLEVSRAELPALWQSLLDRSRPLWMSWVVEGLQDGTNFTWNLLLQKRITKFLDANLSYFGRKSEGSKTVHTGSVQLRAYF